MFLMVSYSAVDPTSILMNNYSSALAHPGQLVGTHWIFKTLLINFIEGFQNLIFMIGNQMAAYLHLY